MSAQARTLDIHLKPQLLQCLMGRQVLRSHALIFQPCLEANKLAHYHPPSLKTNHQDPRRAPL